VWDRLRKQVEVEREQLHELIDTHHPLLEKCAVSEPDAIEVSALGAMLHAFYTGLENTFRRIEVELGEELPQGEGWHRRLLGAMTQPGRRRPAVLSSSTEGALRQYLGFRHVFRQAYGFQLKWLRMSQLVLECEGILEQVEGELERFLAAGPREQ
jgi:hypothetical protein